MKPLQAQKVTHKKSAFYNPSIVTSLTTAVIWTWPVKTRPCSRSYRESMNWYNLDSGLHILSLTAIRSVESKCRYKTVMCLLPMATSGSSLVDLWWVTSSMSLVVLDITDNYSIQLSVWYDFWRSYLFEFWLPPSALVKCIKNPYACQVKQCSTFLSASSRAAITPKETSWPSENIHVVKGNQGTIAHSQNFRGSSYPSSRTFSEVCVRWGRVYIVGRFSKSNCEYFEHSWMLVKIHEPFWTYFNAFNFDLFTWWLAQNISFFWSCSTKKAH